MIDGSEQLGHQIEVQARQIEAVFQSVNHPVQVDGGSVDGRWVVFDLWPGVQLGHEQASALDRQLAQTLRVTSARLQFGGEKTTLAIRRPPVAAADLLGLLRSLPGLPPATAVLGLDEAERPVFLNLASSCVTNILLSGAAGCGTRSLIRALLVSLALENRQSAVQMAAVDYGKQPEGADRGQGLYPLGLLPHMLRPTLTDLEEIAGFLGYLNEEAGHRQEQKASWPLIVVVLSELERLLGDGGQPIREPLAHLLQAGPEAGIHLVLHSCEPQAADVRLLLRGNVTVRLSGRQVDSAAARAATGISGSEAEYLPGAGRFLAASAGTVVRFQSAALSDYDLHLILERLRRQRSPTLVARPANFASRLGRHDTDFPSVRFDLRAS